VSLTTIEWADRTWNPITGCTPVSEGCAHCYAERMAKRLRGRYGYPADDPFRVTLHPDRLDEPLRWRKPSMVFVCSMGDLFHEDVPDEFIEQVFGVMAAMSEHVFLVLTKRPLRMAAFMERGFSSEMAVAYEEIGQRDLPETMREYAPGDSTFPLDPELPLPNVWAGTSVENQAAADERIPHLLRTPAAKRFLSCEPLLGEVDIVAPIGRAFARECGIDLVSARPVGMAGHHGIDGAIVGGESGPGARPMHPDWPRRIRDDCVAAGVPFFFKQWGDNQGPGSGLKGHPSFEAGYRPGAKKGGRLLDGREWNEMPSPTRIEGGSVKTTDLQREMTPSEKEISAEKKRIAELEGALKKAVQVIKQWHNLHDQNGFAAIKARIAELETALRGIGIIALDTNQSIETQLDAIVDTTESALATTRGKVAIDRELLHEAWLFLVSGVPCDSDVRVTCNQLAALLKEE